MYDLERPKLPNTSMRICSIVDSDSSWAHSLSSLHAEEKAVKAAERF